MPPIAHNCLTCTRTLTGRSDKKFCSDYCRNDYNNKLQYSSNNHYMRRINHALRRNRQVLEQLFKTQPGKDKVIVAKAKLNDLGFRFKYITSTYTTKKETVYYYCYEYGYLPLQNDFYLLVKNKEE